MPHPKFIQNLAQECRQTPFNEILIYQAYKGPEADLMPTFSSFQSRKTQAQNGGVGSPFVYGEVQVLPPPLND